MMTDSPAVGGNLVRRLPLQRQGPYLQESVDHITTKLKTADVSFVKNMVLYIVAYLGRTSTWMHDAAYSTIGSSKDSICCCRIDERLTRLTMVIVEAVLAARSYLFDNLKTVPTTSLQIWSA